MLTTIEALEKDLALFQKNIQGSSQLIEIIQNTIQSVDSQSKLFEEKTSVMQGLIRQLPENIERQNTKNLTEHKQNISDMLQSEHTIYLESVQGYKEQLLQCIHVLESKQAEYLQLMQDLYTSFEGMFVQQNTDLTQFKTTLLKESRAAMSEMNAESAKTSAEHVQQVEKSVQDCKDHIAECITAIETKQAEYLQLMQNLQTSFEGLFVQQNTDLTQFKTSLLEESRAAMSEMNAESAKTSAEHVQQVEKSVQDCKDHIAECITAIETKQAEYLQLMQTAQVSLDAACEKHSTELNNFRTDLAAESRRAMAELSVEHTQALEVYLRQMKSILDDTKTSMDSHVGKISDAVQGILQSEQRYSAHLQETQQNFAEQIQRYLTGLTTAQSEFEQKYVNITDSLHGFVDTLKDSNKDYANDLEHKVLEAVGLINKKDSELSEKIESGFTSTKADISDGVTYLAELTKGINAKLFKFIPKITEKSTNDVLNAIQATTNDNNLDKVYDLLLKMQRNNRIGFIMLGIGMFLAIGLGVAGFIL